MQSPAHQPCLEVKQVGMVTVVAFTQAEVLHEEAIDAIGKQLARLVEHGGHRDLVLNFGSVVRLASDMLGELIVLHKKAYAVGGRIALCQFSPELREVFDVLNLDKVFKIYGTEQEALQSIWIGMGERASRDR